MVNTVIAGLAVVMLIMSFFSLTDRVSYGSVAPIKSIDVQVENATYTATYQMSNGGTIDSISTDTTGLDISLEITSPSDGVLEITFPRELYDALKFTEHHNLELGPIVSVDGNDAIHPEVTQSCEQTSIRIPVAAGAEKIELGYGDILAVHSHSYPARIVLLPTIAEEGQEFALGVITDAKKCDLLFVKEEKNLHVDIEGRTEAAGVTHGYFRLLLPHGLLGGNYTVLVDGDEVNFGEQIYYFPSYDQINVQSSDPDDYNSLLRASELSFNYTSDAARIDIIGTTAIPEFGSAGLFATATAAAIVGVIIVANHFGVGGQLRRLP